MDMVEHGTAYGTFVADVLTGFDLVADLESGLPRHGVVCDVRVIRPFTVRVCDPDIVVVAQCGGPAGLLLAVTVLNGDNSTRGGGGDAVGLGTLDGVNIDTAAWAMCCEVIEYLYSGAIGKGQSVEASTARGWAQVRAL
jgi:hypothetical protein